MRGSPDAATSRVNACETTPGCGNSASGGGPVGLAGFEGTYSRDDYFALLGRMSELVPDYRLEVVSCEAYGDELVVVVYIRSPGTSPQGPVDENGGLMIYRVVAVLIVERWAVSQGRDAKTPF